jgi:hypothetical protein
VPGTMNTGRSLLSCSLRTVEEKEYLNLVG